jgi:flagellin-like protein
MNKGTLSLPENTRAISSVVGVALMVGIVVVLSGVIGFAVLDFGDDIGAEPTASVNVEQTADNEFRVTWVSQGNADYLSFSGDADTVTTPSSGSDLGGAADPESSVSVLAAPGESATITFSGSGGSQTVTANIADNPDDRSAVIQVIENS